jgi:hypothetical protein
MLLKANYQIVVIDKFHFGDQSLHEVRNHPSLLIRRCDVRDIAAADLVGVDTIVSLAAISNDPSGDLSPHWTIGINQAATIRLAELAANEGVRKFRLRIVVQRVWRRRRERTQRNISATATDCLCEDEVGHRERVECAGQR